MVYERKTGLEYRFIPSGPKIAPRELESCIATIRKASFDTLVASGSIPAGCAPDILAQIGDIAAEKGAKFVLDSSGAGLSRTIGHTPVYLVKPSLNEFQALVGRDLDGQGVAEAALGLVAKGKAGIVAVTLGMDGAIVASAAGAFRVAAPKVETRSTVGAGDSFLAAMTVALSEGKSVEEAALFGTAAGAAAVLAPGTRHCSRADIYRLYDEIRRDPAALQPVGRSR
jgi:6-phosphofructokinase 2